MIWIPGSACIAETAFENGWVLLMSPPAQNKNEPPVEGSPVHGLAPAGGYFISITAGKGILYLQGQSGAAVAL